MQAFRSERNFWCVAAAVFALMIVCNYFPVLFGWIPFPVDVALKHSAWDERPRIEAPQRVPQLIDIVAFFYPFRALVARAAQEHTIPLWNPYIMAGAPFQANSQSALFAPLTSLYYVLPLKVAWTAELAIRLFLAALFMTLFVRSIGGSPAGAILSGILFALCGFTIEWQGQTSLAGSSIWLPLICYSVHRLRVNPTSRSIAISAVAFAMPVLSGHPETAAHSTLTGCAMAALLFFVKPFDWRFLLRFTLSGLLALGLATVQILPTLQFLELLGPQFDSAQPVLDRHQVQGFFSRDIGKDPSSAEVAVPEGAAYVGMLGLLAASMAFFHRPRRYVLFLACITVVASGVAFGFQPLRWVVVHLPFIKAMKNGRMLLIADFGIAAMAGLGVSALERPEVPRSQMGARGLMLLSVAFLAIGGCIYEVFRATFTPVEFWRSPWASVIFLCAAFSLLAARLSGYVSKRAFPVAICALAAVEMLSFSFGYLGFTRPAEVFPTAPVFDFLQTRGDPGTFRVAKDPYPIPHDVGTIYGFDAADGYELITERAREFTSGLTQQRDDGMMFITSDILRAQDRRLDLLNLKYFIVTRPGPEFDLMTQRPDRFVPAFAQASVAVFENPSVLPRAFLVPLSGIELIGEASAQLDRIKQPAFDPERSVILSEPPPDLRDSTSSAEPSVGGQVAQVHSGINESTFQTQSLIPVVLVVSQMYYPGWKATVDGTEVPVVPVDYALTGLIAPAGTHNVRLFFQPVIFRVGAAISLLSLIVICGLAITRSRREPIPRLPHPKVRRGD